MPTFKTPIIFSSSPMASSVRTSIEATANRCTACNYELPAHHFWNVSNLSSKSKSNCLECQLRAYIERAPRSEDDVDENDQAILFVGSIARYEQWVDEVRKRRTAGRNLNFEQNARKMIATHTRFEYWVHTIPDGLDKAHEIVKYFQDSGNEKAYELCFPELSEKQQNDMRNCKKRKEIEMGSTPYMSPPPTTGKRTAMGKLHRVKHPDNTTMDAEGAGFSRCRSSENPLQGMNHREDQNTEVSPEDATAEADDTDSVISENANDIRRIVVDNNLSIHPRNQPVIGSPSSPETSDTSTLTFDRRSTTLAPHDQLPTDGRARFLRNLQKLLQGLYEEMKTKIERVPPHLAEHYLQIPLIDGEADQSHLDLDLMEAVRERAEACLEFHERMSRPLVRRDLEDTGL